MGTQADTKRCEPRCPPWCRRAHLPDDHPDDKRHQGAGHVVVVTVAGEMPPPRRPLTTEVVVHADKGIDERETWIRIESLETPDVRLALTAESARDLAQAIAQAVSEVSPFRDV